MKRLIPIVIGMLTTVVAMAQEAQDSTIEDQNQLQSTSWTLKMIIPNNEE